MAESVVMCWSGGKDSALALQVALKEPSLQVEALLTTVTDEYDRISMHGVREALLQAQVDAIGITLEQIRIPKRASNELYEQAMTRAFLRYKTRGISRVIFGDLFLEGIRQYREKQLSKLDMQGIFPLWLRDTRELAKEFIREGFRAVLVCVDPKQIDPSFCGREYDEVLLADLPRSADPCGENGEFHTFVYDGPNFNRVIRIEKGDVVHRDGFWFCDFKQLHEQRPGKAVSHS